LRLVLVGARALGMLSVGATVGAISTLLLTRLLPMAIGFVGALRLLCACLASIVGLGQYMHWKHPSRAEGL